MGVGGWQLRPRPLKLIVGKPIATNHMTYADRDTLSDTVKAEVAKMKQVYLPTPTTTTTSISPLQLLYQRGVETQT